MHATCSSQAVGRQVRFKHSMIERSQSSPREDVATSLSLLVRLRVHDRAAWQEFLSLYAPLVVRWCYRRGLSEPDVADVAQEVFLRVSRSIEQFRKENPGDSLRGWLCRITHRQLAQFFRDRETLAEASGGTEAHILLQQQADRHPQESEDEARQEVRYLYQRAMDIARGEFSESTWKMFFRTAVDGNRAVEVAQEFGATAAAVRQARSRVLRRLKEVVGDQL